MQANTLTPLDEFCLSACDMVNWVVKNPDKLETALNRLEYFKKELEELCHNAR